MCRRRWMGLALSLLLVVCCVPFAACNDASVDGDDGKIVVALDWTPNINHTGLYVAQELGYFAEEGLEIQIIQPQDNVATQLIAADQADFGYSYQEEVTFARVAGLPVVSLAAVIQHNTSCFAALAESGIRTIADFAGHTYGGWGGEVENALIEYFMEQEGKPGSVNILNIGTSDFFTAVEDGTIDFSWIYYGVTGVEAELRGVDLSRIYLRDIDPTFDYYTPVIIASETMLTEKPELVKSFMRALSRGYQYADANPEEAADILIEAVPEVDADLVRAGQAWLSGQYQGDATYWGEQKLTIWQGFADWLYQRGLLEEGFVAEDAFSDDYLPKDALENEQPTQQEQ